MYCRPFRGGFSSLWRSRLPSYRDPLAFAAKSVTIGFRSQTTQRPMPEFTLRVKGAERKVNVAPETPLLWVLRDTLELTGTKYGCGAGLCGSCTVHLDGEAARSCV